VQVEEPADPSASAGEAESGFGGHTETLRSSPSVRDLSFCVGHEYHDS
jgi:hypothetical protein